MTDLSFLSIGKAFPPIEEAKRIAECTENELLFEGNSHAAETKHFRETLSNLNKLALKLGWTDNYLAVELNFFKFMSKKTMDFVCGEYPDITVSGDNRKNKGEKSPKQKIIDEIRKNTQFDEKHGDTWIKVPMYGSCPWRIYRDGDHDTFTLVQPQNFFKIVSPEDPYKVTQYVITNLAYDEKVKKVILTAQIHEKGQFTTRQFYCKPFSGFPSGKINGLRYVQQAMYNTEKANIYTLILDRLTDEIFRWSPVTIEQEITKKPVPIPTNLDDFAIIEINNIKKSDGVYSACDYADVESIVAAQQRVLTEVQLIFDKYTVPTGYGDSDMLAFDENVGENFFEIGKCYGIPRDGVIPGFIQPDISRLEVYFRKLEYLDKQLQILSEFGGVMSAGVVPNSIAIETMKSMYTSELKKAERLTTRNTDKVKKLFSLLSKSYGTAIPEDEISVTWYDGLPNSEQTDITISEMKIRNHLTSRREELRTRYNKTEEEIDNIMEEVMQEQSDFSTYNAVSGGFGGFGSFGSGNVPNHAKEDGDEPTDEEHEDDDTNKGGGVDGEEE